MTDGPGIDLGLFTQMRDTMTHRGPDGAGTLVSSDGCTVLGHRRLSIVDLSVQGQQPFARADLDLMSTCNGEIYNATELRDLLTHRGHVFQSRCDNEVILHGYAEWGLGVVDHLKGMFAFGIWDGKKDRLVLARDRLGIKPLHYYQTSSDFLFASEIKAIVHDPSVPRVLNLDAVNDFLVQRFIPAPSTIWQGVHKLPPASLLVRERGHTSIHRYYTPAPQRLNSSDLDELISEVVGDHLISDAPVGLLLSGGLDSASVASYAQRNGANPTTISLGYEDWHKSEHQLAQLVAAQLGLPHRALTVNLKDLTEEIPRAATVYDEPLGGTSTLPSLMLSRFAALEQKAVLTGDGGDEAFSGYTRYQTYNSVSETLAHYRTALSVGAFTEETLHTLHPSLPRPHRESVHLYATLADEYDGDLDRLMMHLDQMVFLPDLVLAKVDRATMAHSLEARVPFADHRIVDAARGLDSNALFREGRSKAILRDLVGNRLPAESLRHAKQGFGSPVKQTLEMKSVGDFLAHGQLIEHELLTKTAVLELQSAYNTAALWPLIVLENWARRWL